MAVRMQHKRGTALQWATVNPILADGELGIAKDTGTVKVGDGFKRWNELTTINSLEFETKANAASVFETKTQADLKFEKRYATGVRPEDYGAIGDGVFDDYISLTNALNESNTRGVPLILSDKIYRLGASGSVLTIPNNSTIQGSGIKSTIDGVISIGSRVTLRDFKVGRDGLANTASPNASDSYIENVIFSGGSTGGVWSMNDKKVTNFTFINCEFSNNISGGNGVQIVDKGTAAKHFENIIFKGCLFRNNSRMNFECIQRNDSGFPVVSGYRNINLIDCVMEPPTGNGGASTTINVSYDGGIYDSGVTDELGCARTSGHSVIKGCKITGGAYGIELAGAVRMQLLDNEVKDTTSSLLSTSQIGTELSFFIIKGNRFTSTAARDVVVAGNRNIFSNNIVKTGGRAFRGNPCTETLVKDNIFETTGVTCISLETSSNMHFDGNYIRGGTNQLLLNIYVGSTGNRFTNNYMHAPNVVLDLRDGTTVVEKMNKYYISSTVNWESPPIPFIPNADVYPAFGTTGWKNRGHIVSKLGTAGVGPDQLAFALYDASAPTPGYRWVPLGDTLPHVSTRSTASTIININAATDNLRTWITILEGPVATANLTSPRAGQRLGIGYQQLAAGGKTYTWPTNCRFAGNTAPVDTTGNTRTTVEFVYDLASALWLEVGRSVAVPVV